LESESQAWKSARGDYKLEKWGYVYERKQYICARHERSLSQSRNGEESVANASTQPEGSPSLAIEQVRCLLILKTPNLLNRVLATTKCLDGPSRLVDSTLCVTVQGSGR
jgi:hypothetical protein